MMPELPTHRHAAVAALALACALVLDPARGPATAPTQETPLPETLAATGLYADFTSRTIGADNCPFAPQYPLWSDGATKRRWIYLPPGSAVDASTADAWQFPVGTKLWKEFSFKRPFETRFVERTPSGWRFAAYAWSDDGATATLVPEEGAVVGEEIAPGVRHRIPTRRDCRVCHDNGKTPVLGFSALQLSRDRDPNAAHRESVPPGALDLDGLARGGRLRGFSGRTTPRVAARTPTERAALGYLHANCGTCHRDDGALASLGMFLASPASARPDAPRPQVDTTVDRPSSMAPERLRIARHEPDRSLLLDRMRSRSPTTQMPPLGTQLVDHEGVRLVTAWIAELAD